MGRPRRTGYCDRSEMTEDFFLRDGSAKTMGSVLELFVYYRRVVENHKDQILDEIIKVAKKISPEMVANARICKAGVAIPLKALNSVKDAIPHALLINGQNR